MDKPQVLIVEDSPVTQKMLESTLHDFGLEVTLSGSGEEALTFLKSERHFDLIILDFNLPGMTGPNFYEEICDNEEWKNIPVVPFTSLITEQRTSLSPIANHWSDITLNRRADDYSNPIVSKGDQEHISKIPSSLILAIAGALRMNDVKLPPKLESEFRNLVNRTFGS